MNIFEEVEVTCFLSSRSHAGKSLIHHFYTPLLAVWNPPGRTSAHGIPGFGQAFGTFFPSARTARVAPVPVYRGDRGVPPPATLLVKQDESIVLFYNKINNSDRWT